MPGLVKRTVRTTQPQTAVGIDWSNPITKGLFSVLDSSGVDYILNVKGHLWNNNIVTNKVTKLGKAVDFGQNQIDFPTKDYAKVESNSTHIVIAEKALQSNWKVAAIHYGSTLRYYGGALAFLNGISRANFDGTQWNGVATLGVVQRTNSYYDYSLFINGNVLNTTGNTSGDMLDGFTATLGGSAIGDRSSVTWWDEPIHLSMRFNRSLSEGEMRSITANPWQIFQPDVSYLDAIYQERLTISPDESRWMGSRGRSTEVSEVIQKHTSTRTSQPQGPVEIDWGNPITKGLVSAIIPGTSNSDIVNKKPFNATNPKKVYSSGVAINTNNYGQKTNSFPKLNVDATMLWLGIIDIQAGTGQLLTNRWAYHGTGIPIGLCSYASPARVGFNVLGIANALIFPITTLPGSLVSFIGKRSNTLGSLFENGVLLGTNTFNNTPIVNDDVFPLTFGSLSNETNNEKLNGSHMLGCVWDRALSNAEIKSISANPWQIFKPHQKTLVYERQVPKIDPPKPKVKAMKLVKHVRTQQPQLTTPITTHTLGKSFNTFIDVFAGNIRLSKHTGSRLSNLIWDTGKFLDSEGSYYITHGNPGAAASVGLNTSAKELTYHVSFREIGASNGHFIGNAAPNYGINKGTSILRGATLDAVMVGAGPVITTVVGPARVLNKWKTLTIRIHNNGVNSTISLFDNGILFGTNTGAFVPATQNAISLCTTMADYYPGTHSVHIRSLGVWDRALSDAEIKSISDNPWQIFQPESKTVWVDA